MRKFTALAVCAALSFGLISTASADLVATQQLDFGEYPVGSVTVTSGVTIINDSSSELINVDLSVRGAEFWFSAGSCGTVFPPGASCLLNVHFTPARPGHFVGFVAVTGDDSGGTQAVTIRLEADAFRT